MREFLFAYGTLILAIVGIVQVWVIASWKKFGVRGTVRIYETGRIEIGYSNWGPTIGLLGTLRALNREVFVVQAIHLQLTREKDKAQHNLQWLAFRPPEINFGPPTKNMEIPSGFLLAPNAPHRFNIIFNDTQQMNEARPLLDSYFDRWRSAVWNIEHRADRNEFGETVPDRNEMIAAFRRERITNDSYGLLDRNCYWEPGAYRLQINVTTSKPDRIFCADYRLILTKQDHERLRLNAVAILEDPIQTFMGIPSPTFNFAYADYEQRAQQP